jgi:two-component system CheB/CheR fusion protein
MVRQEKTGGQAKRQRAEKRTRPIGSGTRSRAAIPPPPGSIDRSSITIVAIGASAGGLEAFEQFFRNMPGDSNLGFILIPHLSPEHKSIMPQLLSRHTKMTVVQADNGMQVMPNHVYIIPPDKDMSILDGTLQLFEPVERRGIRHPIDFFFRSLAQDQGEKAVCIVLSGTGTEGTLGLKAVKGEGGLVLVQDPKTAKYDGMPGSAVATGLADYVLPPAHMPSRLLTFIKSPARCLREASEPSEAKPLDALLKIFVLIRQKTGHDFSQYKHSTVLRRMERRMAVLQLENHADYVAYLRNNPHEIDTLFKELLIRVTNFFRDPEAFDAFMEKALPAVFQNRPVGVPIRIWVPGCSTGEEAYSLAILLHEYNLTVKEKFRVQIFASDIDAGSIEIARSGLYPANITVDVSLERLGRYFTRKDTVYKIKDEIRETIIFAEHDINKDPPFSKMDIISCRNLLIYLGAELQQRSLRLFCYALNPDGILFLGSSETIGNSTDMFSVVDKKYRIFRSRRTGSAPLAPVDVRHAAPATIAPAPLQDLGGKRSQHLGIAEVAEKLLLARHTPSCAAVDPEGAIVFLHGRTGKYLEPASGKANMNILLMAREGLQSELRAALRKASTKKSDVSLKGLQVRANGRYQMINIDVHYLKEPEQLQGLLLVVFTDVLTLKTEKAGKHVAVSDKKLRQQIKELEGEVKYAKEHLQTVVEEMETTHEELQSSNEELQSANEELQSSNEEMETAKEELQSSNEELMTVNSELQSKMDDLAQVNNDMMNLQTSTRIATIFLDRVLRIKGYTPDSTDVINLIQSDVGRPLKDISWKIDYLDLMQDAEAVLRTLTMKEQIVQHQEGGWYLVRTMPYRTSSNVIDGVTITFVDITEQKRLQAALENALQFSQGIVDTMREPLIVLDAGLRVISANNAFYEMFQTDPRDTENTLIYDLGSHQWDIPALRKALEEILPQNSQFKDFLVEHDFPAIGRRKMLLNGRRIVREGVKTQTILLAIDDITEKP